MEFFATCARGLEHILAEELRALKTPGVRPLSSGVFFHGQVKDAYRAALWSRVASRILLTLARIEAADADVLYEQVKAISWEDHIASGRTIVVEARGSNEKLRDTRFTALRVKDAICDRLREVHGMRPDVDVRNPDVSVDIVVRGSRATVSIDLSGGSLENRGYRVGGKPACMPIRETVAAAALVCAGWPKLARAGHVLIDPVCGEGTVAIEAALMAGDVAPGATRSHWGFTGWAGHDEAAFDELLDECDARAWSSCKTRIFAIDEDAACLKHAKQRAKRAAAYSHIEFFPSYQETLDAVGSAEHALLACSIAQGAQSVTARLPFEYARVLACAHGALGVEQMVLVSYAQDADVQLGMNARFETAVKTGKQEGSIRLYDVQGAKNLATVISVRGQKVFLVDAEGEQFAARLAKVEKQRRKWAAKNKVSAYRVYDADLPDYNMAIDVYKGAAADAPKTMVHVAEYAPPASIDANKASRRMADALRIIPIVFGVDADDVYVKRRVRSRGGSQYAQAAQGSNGLGHLVTCENGLLYEVDMTAYLDTGLFLDHRDTRALIKALAKEKSFLNLFAYTGSASVAAAAGGAKFTTSVDMSNTYLQWAQRNMQLNGLLDNHQEFKRADAMSWVAQTRHTKLRWDFIFIDPPTFSNSAKMGKRTWDVQKDHAELLIGASRLLTRGGFILFSCNLRNFKLDAEALDKACVEARDITARTIPEDFSRNPKVHHCYLLCRKTA